MGAPLGSGCMWTMSVPIATGARWCCSAPRAANMLCMRTGNGPWRRRRRAEAHAAATPSVVARFRNLPVSRAMPKRPRWSRHPPTLSLCQLEVAHQAGAVDCKGGHVSVLDQIGTISGPSPTLMPCAPMPTTERGARDGGGRVAQVASRQDVGQPVEPRAHAEPARSGFPSAAAATLPNRAQRHRMDVRGSIGGGVVRRRFTPAPPAPSHRTGGLPVA